MKGRPPLDVASPTTQVTVRLSVKQLDDLCRQATAARVSLPELIRRKLDAKRQDGLNESSN